MRISDGIKAPDVRRWLIYSGGITILAMVAVAWLSFWQSATYEQCIRDYPERKAAQADQEGLPYLFFVRGRGVGCIGIAVAANEDTLAAWSAVFTAFFTGVLFISTAGLWWVTERSLDHARSEAERQAGDMKRSLAIAKQAAKATIWSSRPWLFVEVGVGGPLSLTDRGGGFQIQVNVKNVGNAPATRVNLFSRLMFGDLQQCFALINGIRHAPEGSASRLEFMREEGATLFPGQNWMRNESAAARSEDGLSAALGAPTPTPIRLIVAVTYRCGSIKGHTINTYGIVIDRNPNSVCLTEGAIEPSRLWLNPLPILNSAG